ncbi:MAG: hypothetical protein H0Z39_08185 [Peptococcaceae bacterium]|nr:hypothetical protein [Peptococcaceae bacterium]
MPKIALIIISILVFIIFFVFTVSFIANFLFNQNVKKEVRELFNSNVENKDEIIQKADLEMLPLCVQKWLEYSQVIGKERIRTVRLKQKAVMRMKEGQPWMPTEAEQYFTIDEPGFIWKAKVKAAPLLHIVGRDKYYEGKGNMLIKIPSLITVADSKGKELDQGTLLRYLAETVWFPTAALSSYITWEEIDANSAKATMSYRGVTASGVFMFNEKGEVINFVAERYGQFDGQYVLETWSVLIRDYKEFNGIRIPTKGEVIWKLKTGDFSWYHFEITEIEYNKPVVY